MVNYLALLTPSIIQKILSLYQAFILKKSKTMRNIILGICLLLMGSLWACNNAKQAQEGQQFFGEKITDKNVSTIQNMLNEMEKTGAAEMQTKVAGEVTDVCQMKGCWMTLKKPDGDNMRVRFKDYGFFMPKDLAGQEVIVRGIAKLDTTSVDLLRHYAEDAGEPAEEIAKITEPLVEVTFEADGVMIKK